MRYLMAVAGVLLVASAAQAEQQVDPVLCRPTQAPIVLEHRRDGRVVAHIEYAAPRPTACDAFLQRGIAWTVQRCDASGICEPWKWQHPIAACGTRPGRPGQTARPRCYDTNRIVFLPHLPGLYTVLVDVELEDHRIIDRAFVRAGRRPANAR